MFDSIFGIHEQALLLHGQRIGVLATNLANADTPNYKAVDIDFGQALKAATSAGPGSVSTEPAVLYRNPTQPSLDGNTVEMDAERAQFADNTIRYEAALRVLNAQIKTMLSAVQG